MSLVEDDQIEERFVSGPIFTLVEELTAAGPLALLLLSFLEVRAKRPQTRICADPCKTSGVRTTPQIA